MGQTHTHTPFARIQEEEEEAERVKWMLRTALDELHMQGWHVTVRTAMCTRSCLFGLRSGIPTCHSTPGHGHMPSAWPADQRRSGLA